LLLQRFVALAGKAVDSSLQTGRGRSRSDLGFATMRRLRLAALPRRAFAGLPLALERCRIAFPEAQEAIVSVQTNIREGAWEGSVQPPCTLNVGVGSMLSKKA